MWLLCRCVEGRLVGGAAERQPVIHLFVVVVIVDKNNENPLNKHSHTHWHRATHSYTRRSHPCRWCIKSSQQELLHHCERATRVSFEELCVRQVCMESVRRYGCNSILVPIAHCSVYGTFNWYTGRLLFGIWLLFANFELNHSFIASLQHRKLIALMETCYDFWENLKLENKLIIFKHW